MIITFQANSVFAQVGAVVGGFVNRSEKLDRIVKRSVTQENINGLNITVLRIAEADIKSKAKSNIIALQNRLSEYLMLYKNNQLVNVPRKDDDLTAIIKKDEDWPIRYYTDELNAYILFTIKRQQKFLVVPQAVDSLHGDSIKKG